jgi:long-chain acyl-CoA synthetase
VVDGDGRSLGAGEIGELCFRSPQVVDRIKDVVIRGGENVYCTEVEAVLDEHPAVAEVTVVGLQERAMDELPKTATSKVAKNVVRQLVADDPEAIDRLW